MTPITVNGHNLLVIDVPKEATNFTNNLRSCQIDFDIKQQWKDGFLTISDCVILKDYWENSLSIIGTISKEGEFSFDPSDYVELHQITRLMIRGFKNYVKTTETQTDFTCKTSKESFISLLKSAGIYLSNPMGEKPDINDPDPHSQYYGCQMDDLSKWESNESKTIKGQALILKQDKV